MSLPICLIAIPVGTVWTLATPHKQRNSNIEALYAILKGKRSPLGAGNCNPLRQGLPNGILKVENIPT
ncbi:hypothetical protein U3516DRAFT_753896 [Neocallimastix sp. 'constans']